MMLPPNAYQISGQVESSQAELVKRIATGDQHALAALYDRTNRIVFGLLLRILRDTAAAEEVLLDVYTQVWRQAATYSERRGTPLAWLTTIARSRAIDRLRSTRLEKQRSEPLDVLSAHASSACSIEEDMVTRELGGRVRAALAALSPEQREVIELAYYGGLSHSEIAMQTGQPLGTVKTRTRLGMMRLREMLETLYRGMR